MFTLSVVMAPFTAAQATALEQLREQRDNVVEAFEKVDRFLEGFDSNDVFFKARREMKQFLVLQRNNIAVLNEDRDIEYQRLQYQVDEEALAEALDYIEDDIPPVLFRLLYPRKDGPRVDFYNSDGDLFAEDPSLPLCQHTVDAHLSWQHVKTPLISFFSSWTKIMRKRHQILRQGVNTDIQILAIDTSRIRGILSAEKIARALLYNDRSPDRRRKVHYHIDEYLIYGGIGGIAIDANPILAKISGGGREVQERPGGRGSPFREAIPMPEDFLNTVTVNVESELAEEISFYTGDCDYSKLSRLLSALYT